MRTKIKFICSTDALQKIQLVRVEINREDGYHATGVGCAVLSAGDQPDACGGVMYATSRAAAEIACFDPDPYGRVNEALALAAKTMQREINRRVMPWEPGMLQGTFQCAVWQ